MGIPVSIYDCNISMSCPRDIASDQYVLTKGIIDLSTFLIKSSSISTALALKMKILDVYDYVYGAGLAWKKNLRSYNATMQLWRLPMKYLKGDLDRI